MNAGLLLKAYTSGVLKKETYAPKFMPRNAENLVMHELIGLAVRVSRSSDPGKKGIRGTVVDETRNTLVIETRSGRKVLPKTECTFHFTLPGGEVVEVEGRAIVARPEDRTKKMQRLMERWR